MKMTSNGPTSAHLSPERLAQLIDHYGKQALAMIVTALHQLPSEAASAESPTHALTSTPTWQEVGVIEDFHHPWPEVHEHYDPMPVFEARDEHGPVRFAIGKPRERMPIYGSERGWISVWEVINKQPREQRAVFVETDDFETTDDHIALISGKDRQARKLFEPSDRHLLPAIYEGMRVETHRERCVGPYAKNRLGVVAASDEADVMLDHALAHLRLRT